jgi:hypothetical protein
MSGLLEQMMERLARIEDKIDAIGVPSMSPSVTVDEAAAEAVKQSAETATVEEELQENPVESADNDTDIELDASGYPWDERINAKTQTKTAAGVWKLLKGVDKDLVPQVREELKAAGYGPQATATTETPSTPVTTPSKPTMPDNSPSVPLKPTMPTQPVTPTVQVDPKQELLKLVNTLQTKGVAPESIVTELLGPFGIDTFDALAVDNMVGVTALANEWLESIGKAQDIIDNLDAIDADGTNGLIDGANIYIQNHGGTGAIGSIPRAQLNEFIRVITDYFNQWDTFLKSQG